jgi:polysaccharide pyruvyl transferase WcaK-like protein
MQDESILLISRLTTQNAGNEALSKELINFFKTKVSERSVRAIDRYPRYFERFSLDKLGSDVVRGFEAAVSRILAIDDGGSAVALAPLAREDQVRLDHRGHELGGALRKLKRMVAYRKRLASIGLIERDQLKTALRSCKESKLVVWNPAGEIHPVAHGVDHVYRLLLMLALALRSGHKAAVINHSLEIEDDRLRKLIAHVYAQLDYVGVRDAKSAEVALDLGVPPAKIIVSPDLVFLARRRPGGESVADVPAGSIALAINGLEAMEGTNEWQELMTGLAALKRPLVFVTNAVNHDRTFSQEIAAMAGGGTVVMHQPGYQDLRGYLRPCSVLISSRLHSSVLALAEGVPVVSIEPSLFKLTAIFQQMDYPIPTVRLQEAGWSQRVLANVQRCLADSEAMKQTSLRAIDEQIDRIESGYAELVSIARSS